ncbi:MAG: DUF6249 domain-containing protein [Saonia sp.]
MVGAVFICLFIVVFGVFYLYFSTRNKERLALIEKGADANIFVREKRGNAPPIWKVLILNLALLLMGIGLAIFIASVMVYNMNVEEQIAYPGTIFLMAGTCLLAGFFLTKKLDREE